ncbi:MAG: hypothetical protein QG648_194 [Patescibacteria group bacterium]|nr:hypothetical protein [Patescibacteria group bacterium]
MEEGAKISVEQGGTVIISQVSDNPASRVYQRRGKKVKIVGGKGKLSTPTKREWQKLAELILLGPHYQDQEVTK